MNTVEYWKARAEAAEAALKEAQEQEPCAFWWIGPDGKDNGGPYRGKPSDVAIDNARNMGCEPVLLYACPVPAVSADLGQCCYGGLKTKQYCASCAVWKPSVAVPEWFLSKLREILFASVVPEIPPHLVSNLPESWDEDFRNMYLRRLREECAANTRLGVILRARALLQSTGEKK